ncbi:MAG: GTPase HflX [Myxococcota bacterium]
MIHGNTLGLKREATKKLENLYRRRMGGDEVFSPELARQMAEMSREINRRVGVLVDRNGRVSHVIVGAAQTLALPDIGRERTSAMRFRGLRLVQTQLGHLMTGRDDQLKLVRNRLDLMASIVAEDDGRPGVVQIITLMPPGGDSQFRTLEYPAPERVEFDFNVEMENLEAEFARKARKVRQVAGVERALLIGLSTGANRDDPEEIIAEMKELARTAGVVIAEVIWQRRREADQKYLLGKGKLEDITVAAMQHQADFLLYALDLTPSQARSIEDVTGFKTIDRTQLILDIFASRAKTRDGKLQVELAQLKYMLPRLGEMDAGLSRHTGGIGLRGPGETKLELSRRRAREKVARLEAGIKELKKQREVRRSKRKEADLPIISLVGYTNAGKSTLLNRLTNSSVYVEDKLFATLDTSSRRLRFPEERDAIITDTVGFIRDLPQDLVNAFRATLEELSDADLLLHVVDAATPGFEGRIVAVDRILGELELSGLPQILVFNKSDLVDPREALMLANQHNAVAVSAVTGAGLLELLDSCDKTLFAERRKKR